MATPEPVAAAADAPELIVQTVGHVRLMTLNRPARRNALSRGLASELSEQLLVADACAQVRAVVLTGAGERSFCAGADLKEIRAGDASGADYVPWTRRRDRSVYEICYGLGKPIIAALNGSAVAGGFELALACDLVVAHDEVQMGLPEATLGMGATFGSVVLGRKVPMALALELLMTGNYVSAATAKDWGLVNRLVDRSNVVSTAMDLAERIAANAPLSVQRMKAMAVRTSGLAVEAALRLELGGNPYLSEDRREGIQARAEKRPPVWKGR